MKRREYNATLSVIQKSAFNNLNNAIKNDRKYWLYSPGEQAKYWSEFFENGIMALGWDELGDLRQFNHDHEIKQALDSIYGAGGSRKNDILANRDFLNEISIGDVIIVKKGRNELLGYGVVTTDYNYDERRRYYRSVRNVDWMTKGKWQVEVNLAAKTLTDISNFESEHEGYDTYYERLLDIMNKDKILNMKEAFNTWLIDKYGKKSSTRSSYLKSIEILSEIHSKDLFTITSESFFEKFYEDLLENQTKKGGRYMNSNYPPSYADRRFYSASIKAYLEFLKSGYMNNQTLVIENKKKSPVNEIFYGPPGTGKTYTLKTEYFPQYTMIKGAVTKEQYFEQVASNLSWFEAIALAILDNKSPMSVPELKANRWIKVKSKYSDAKNIGALLWGQLQSHTIDECESVKVKRRLPPLIFNKSEDKLWEISKEDFEELKPDFSDILEKLAAFQANDHFEIKRYEFVTFHQSYAYEDFIEGIKPVMESEGESELRYEIKDGIFKMLCKRAKNDPENRYAIFIDEINRGNVSSIFGELITLIESDKRLGMDNAMTITLPYSRDVFGVPGNVDIYGTMNTADRSVEALDTALRRRFAFKEMLPDPGELKNEIDGFAMKDLLICINKRIEALIDRDHTIGHSYLINVKNMGDLKLAFKDKIIPLLQEYFYGDYGKIGLVLGSGFVKMQPRESGVFADFEYDGSEGLAQNKFELIRIDEMAGDPKDADKEFKLALKTLLNRGE